MLGLCDNRKCYITIMQLIITIIKIGKLHLDKLLNYLDKQDNIDNVVFNMRRFISMNSQAKVSHKLNLVSCNSLQVNIFYTSRLELV